MYALRMKKILRNISQMHISKSSLVNMLRSNVTTKNTAELTPILTSEVASNEMPNLVDLTDLKVGNPLIAFSNMTYADQDKGAQIRAGVHVAEKRLIQGEPYQYLREMSARAIELAATDKSAERLADLAKTALKHCGRYENLFYESQGKNNELALDFQREKDALALSVASSLDHELPLDPQLQQRLDAYVQPVHTW